MMLGKEQCPGAGEGKDQSPAPAGLQGHAQEQEGKTQPHAAAQAVQVLLWAKLCRKFPKK